MLDQAINLNPLHIYSYCQHIDAVKEPYSKKTSFQLFQNYPNPFNPSTTISYSIPEDECITLKVYNSLGEEIRTLFNRFQKAGNYEIIFEATGLASGIYIYRLSDNKKSLSGKMMIIK